MGELCLPALLLIALLINKVFAFPTITGLRQGVPGRRKNAGASF